MTFLIIALLVLLFLLSRKYILSLEPAGVFAAIWIIQIAAVMAIQNYIVLRFTGILFILIGVIAFILGTIFCETTYHPIRHTEKRLIFNHKYLLPILAILLVSSMITPLYTILLHGFSLRALLDMRELLEMNKGISEDRYAGVETRDMFSQIFLIFCYVAPLVGGFCFRFARNWVKVICVLMLLPGIFIALTQAMKMGMVSGFILWITGFFVCSYSYDLPLRIKPKGILIALSAFISFFSILVFSMVFRTGEVSEKSILSISQTFVSYALGQLHCFDIWFTSHEPLNYAYGAKTFLGISNVLGIEQRVQGIYAEFHQIGQNGFYGIANVFTIFRSLIEDFGESGTILFMFIIGYATKYSLMSLVNKSHIITNQVIMVSAYAYLLWSFATSFFTYTSYIAMFFVAYIIFRILQTETTYAEAH